MVSDGILPSNEGRGYVLRRLLRRAARHGRMLGIDHPFLVDLVETVIQSSESAYPELREHDAYIKKVIGTEEANFARTIDAGMNILNNMIDRLEKAHQKLLERHGRLQAERYLRLPAGSDQGDRRRAGSGDRRGRLPRRDEEAEGARPR